MSFLKKSIFSSDGPAQPLAALLAPSAAPVSSLKGPSATPEITSAAGGEEMPPKHNSPSEPDLEHEAEPEMEAEAETEEEKARRLLYCSL